VRSADFFLPLLPDCKLAKIGLVVGLQSRSNQGFFSVQFYTKCAVLKKLCSCKCKFVQSQQINESLKCCTYFGFYTDSFMNESVSCYGRLCMYVCMCVTFVDHVQTDHRRNPILCIGAHLYTCHQVA
jgi:hypothetical protein